jgi:hypothetical protein
MRHVSPTPAPDSVTNMSHPVAMGSPDVLFRPCVAAPDKHPP